MFQLLNFFDQEQVFHSIDLDLSIPSINLEG